jgi:hypothetical protein
MEHSQIGEMKDLRLRAARAHERAMVLLDILQQSLADRALIEKRVVEHGIRGKIVPGVHS